MTGIDLLLIMMIALWFLVFIYMLILHLMQRRLSKTIGRVLQSRADEGHKR